MKHTVTVETKLETSFAVDQVRGMFDLKRQKAASETFNVELPGTDEPWQIGVIVGPSGSGKSTVARHAYGKSFVDGFRWHKEKAVVDHFPDESMKTVTQTLTSVGFSSPPAWIKPYHVLSGGERFRCDLARALLGKGELVAFDEFTSVVDRTVAKIGSAAVAKSIRAGRIQKRFVAVTCHYDILEWLEPDWVLDMASCQLARGCLYRRPTIELSIAAVHHTAWQLFRRHHYLNTAILPSSKCFAAFWGQEPVAFSSWVHRITRGTQAKDMREHQTVVLPDFQGVGIGNRVSEYCAAVWKSAGSRVFSTTSHPSMIHYRNASKRWKTVRFGMAAKTGKTGKFRRATNTGKQVESAGRVTGGFQYVGDPINLDRAKQLLADLKTVRPFGSEYDSVLAAVQSSARSKRAIGKQTGLNANVVDRVVARLVANGHLSRVCVGKRVAYSSRGLFSPSPQK